MCAEAPPQLSATPYIRGVVSATMGCFSGDQGHPVFGARRRQRLNTPIVTCALRERVREPTHRDGRSEQATGPSCYDTYRCEQVRGRVQPSRNHCDLISRQTTDLARYARAVPRPVPSCLSLCTRCTRRDKEHLSQEEGGRERAEQRRSR